ncbi:MAG TPA: dimethylmenaquinone methyltransferase [Clostridiales bacterium]|nr:dimethylmenaquinone methyltransferase [Clostridiales bacterium]
MASWKNNEELFHLIREKLYTPVVGDILDQMGYTHQFLPSAIRPLTALVPPNMVGAFEYDKRNKLVGWACTILENDIYAPAKKAFGYLTESLDQLRPDEVYVATGAHNSALWGELLTAASRTKGAVGAVLNGCTRDTPQVLAQNFPVFCTGCWAQDSSVRTYVCDYRCTIEIGQVTIHDGDLIFGDVDGVLVVPREIVEPVMEKALEKAAGEKLVRQAIEGGMSATDAFAKFGIL